jgi:hypothetical protein
MGITFAPEELGGTWLLASEFSNQFSKQPLISVFGECIPTLLLWYESRRPWRKSANSPHCSHPLFGP